MTWDETPIAGIPMLMGGGGGAGGAPTVGGAGLPAEAGFSGSGTTVDGAEMGPPSVPFRTGSPTPTGRAACLVAGPPPGKTARHTPAARATRQTTTKALTNTG